MKKNLIKLCCWIFAASVIIGCKKDSSVTPPPVSNQLTLGLYKYQSGINKRIFIAITKVGTKTIAYLSVFDTGSTGMTIDGNGILPDSMISASGFKFTGDSVVVNGVTVTSKKGTISYGDNTDLITEYGNLAYAAVTIGDENGNATIKKLPIFLYYKIVDITTGKTQPKHSNDVFGAGPGNSYTFTAVASPLSYFKLPAGQTSGFRLAMLNNSNFTGSAVYVAGLLTIGLTSADLNSSGFIMHPLSHVAVAGYSPNIPATISYQGKNVAAQVLFDTGTPAVTIIENPNSVGQLPDSTVVTVKTNKGFTYTYTTMNTNNLTEVENPNKTGDYRSIFSLDFFIKNEFLTDYTDHEIGLKNN